MLTSFPARMSSVVYSLSTYGRLLFTRLKNDNITMIAGHLAYVSLLSLVPFITVILALLSVFPVFSSISQDIKHFIFSHLIPTSGQTIEHYVEYFLANSNKMTALGTAGLIVTSLLLIHAVDKALNHIWRSKKKRAFLLSFSVYWMILTLGPILVGTSMAISTYLLSMQWLSDTGLNLYLEYALRAFPLCLSVVGFWLLYSIVPTERVTWWHAAVGAMVAALLFEGSKSVFAMYVVLFPSYQLIYGVLAVIPLLLIWIYISWCIVLFGAEITVSLGDHHRQRVLK